MFGVKISELIDELKDALRQHGDVDVLVDAYLGLHDIDEVGVDADDTGFILWISNVREDL